MLLKMQSPIFWSKTACLHVRREEKHGKFIPLFFLAIFWSQVPQTCRLTQTFPLAFRFEMGTTSTFSRLPSWLNMPIFIMGIFKDPHLLNVGPKNELSIYIYILQITTDDDIFYKIFQSLFCFYFSSLYLQLFLVCRGPRTTFYDKSLPALPYQTSFLPQPSSRNTFPLLIYAFSLL